MNILLKIHLSYALIAAGILVLVNLLSLLTLGTRPENFDAAEVLGYLGILLSLSVIYVAVDRQRQSMIQARIPFKEAFLIGFWICLLAGVLFGIYNIIYVEFIAPDFMESYYGYYIDQVRQSGLSAAEIDQHIAQLESEKAMFMNPLLQFSVMFFTYFAIGVVVSMFVAGVQSKLGRKLDEPLAD